MQFRLQLILAAAVALFFGTAAAAQDDSFALFGVDNGVTAAAPASYVGPGDLVSGAKAWYGLRAYSAAVAATGSTKAVKAIRASDSMACDAVIATSGDLGDVVTTGACTATGAASAFCTATTCTIDTLYDQLGGAFHAFASGTTPTLVFNCVNGKPCMVFGGAGGLESFSSTATAQTLTISAVAIRTGGFTGQSDIISGANGVFFNSAANQVSGWFGASPAVAATDNAWHALQFVVTGASSTINVNGTASTGQNFGTGDLSADYYIGRQSGGSYLTGKITEVGVWPAGFSSGQQTSMCHNQYVYWGTSVSC